MGLLSAATSIIGGGTPTKVVKLQIQVEGGPPTSPFTPSSDTVTAMFNPETLTLHTEPKWEAPSVKQTTKSTTETPLKFLSLTPSTLQLDLIFDSTEAASDIHVDAKSDVRACSSRIMQLTQIKSDLHRPPLCLITWGESFRGKAWFMGYATSIQQHFSYFDPSGTPLRVKLTCTFTEYMETQEMYSTDVHKSYVDKRGDSLSSIAQEKLHDPTLWRHIATANGLTDPLEIEPGRTLWIPTVRER